MTEQIPPLTGYQVWTQPIWLEGAGLEQGDSG